MTVRGARWICAAALAVAALVTGFAAAVPAQAGDRDAVIQDLSVRDGAATFTLSVTLPAGATLDRGGLRVTVGGQPVEARVTAATSASGRSRVAVLVVDTSGSMGPAGIAAARTAAYAYLARVASDVRVGLVSFADGPHVLTAPTTDRAALRAGLGQLRSKGETALYDAVSLAVRTAGTGGAVIVLSDGADTVSTAGLSDALARIHASGARVSTVAFRTQDGVRGPLTQLARAGGGRIVAASDASDLAAAFAQAAASLPAQLTVSATLPPTVSSGAVLMASVGAGSTAYSASSALVLPASVDGSGGAVAPGRPVAALVGAVPWYGGLSLVLAVVFAALLMLGWLILPRPESMQAKRQRALEIYGLSGRRVRSARTGEPEPAAGAPPAGAAGGVANLSQRIVDRQGSSASVTRRLEAAGSRMRPAEWLVVRVFAVAAAAVVLTVLSGNLLIGLLVGALVGWLGTFMWLRRRQAGRARAFADALPDTLQLVASSLRTGFSLPQALDAAQQDGVQPMAGELGRALAAARIGAPLEDELDLIAERTGSEDWRWAVMAIRIQRSVGGNLAEVLSTTVRTLRDRAANRRMVRSLSAEGRLSAYILIGMPIVVTAALLLFRRDYIRPLWTTTPGLVMVAGAVVFMAIGSWWMAQVVKVEV